MADLRDAVGPRGKLPLEDVFSPGVGAPSNRRSLTGVEVDVSANKSAAGRAVTLLALVVLILAACSSGHPTGLRLPPAPAGWKTVTYHGIGVDVPRRWTVKPWRESCGVSTPTVFIGPTPSPFSADCVEPAGDASEVILVGLQFPATGRATTKALNGVKAVVTTREQVFHGTLGATITYMTVTLPTLGVSISVLVGESPRVPGGAAGRAKEIVDTIHATTNATTTCAASPGWLSITLSDQLPTPMLTVRVGAKVVVNVPRWNAGGDATDVHVGDSHVLQEQCTVLLPDHGRRTILLATAQGRSGLEAITSGLPNGVAVPAWLGRVQVKS